MWGMFLWLPEPSETSWAIRSSLNCTTWLQSTVKITFTLLCQLVASLHLWNVTRLTCTCCTALFLRKYGTSWLITAWSFSVLPFSSSPRINHRSGHHPHHCLIWARGKRKSEHGLVWQPLLLCVKECRGVNGDRRLSWPPGDQWWSGGRPAGWRGWGGGGGGLEHTLPSWFPGVFDHSADTGAGFGFQQQPDRTCALLCSVQPGGFSQQPGHSQSPRAGHTGMCALSATHCGCDPGASQWKRSQQPGHAVLLSRGLCHIHQCGHSSQCAGDQFGPIRHLSASGQSSADTQACSAASGSSVGCVSGCLLPALPWGGLLLFEYWGQWRWGAGRAEPWLRGHHWTDYHIYLPLSNLSTYNSSFLPFTPPASSMAEQDTAVRRRAGVLHRPGYVLPLVTPSAMLLHRCGCHVVHLLQDPASPQHSHWIPHDEEYACKGLHLQDTLQEAEEEGPEPAYRGSVLQPEPEPQPSSSYSLPDPYSNITPTTLLDAPGDVWQWSNCHHCQYCCHHTHCHHTSHPCISNPSFNLSPDPRHLASTCILHGCTGISFCHHRLEAGSAQAQGPSWTPTARPKNVPYHHIHIPGLLGSSVCSQCSDPVYGSQWRPGATAPLLLGDGLWNHYFSPSALCLHQAEAASCTQNTCQEKGSVTSAGRPSS